MRKIIVEVTHILREHIILGTLGQRSLSPVHVCTSCLYLMPDACSNSSKRRWILNPKSQRKYQEAPKYREWSSSLSREAFRLHNHATPITSSYTMRIWTPSAPPHRHTLRNVWSLTSSKKENTSGISRDIKYLEVLAVLDCSESELQCECLVH